jgi:hypothetical protein
MDRFATADRKQGHHRFKQGQQVWFYHENEILTGIVCDYGWSGAYSRHTYGLNGPGRWHTVCWPLYKVRSTLDPSVTIDASDATTWDNEEEALEWLQRWMERCVSQAVENAKPRVTLK